MQTPMMKPCLLSASVRVDSWLPSSTLSAICIGRQHLPKPRLNPTAVVQVSGRSRTCDCFDLHNEVTLYNPALDWQMDILREKQALIEKGGQDCPDSLIILQHHPAYTLRARSSKKYLLFDPEAPPSPDHPPVYETKRGGEVTYHGPGQLVMYPILNLRNHKKDLHWVLRCFEDIVIRTLRSTFSIKASRIPGLTGVWVGNEKVTAMGIHAISWITYHGLALNVTTDLTPFQWIVPCGIRDRKVGSVHGILNQTSLDDSELIDITCKSLIKEFSQVFQLEICYKSIATGLKSELICDRAKQCS